MTNKLPAGTVIRIPQDPATLDLRILSNPGGTQNSYTLLRDPCQFFLFGPTSQDALIVVDGKSLLSFKPRRDGRRHPQIEAVPVMKLANYKRRAKVKLSEIMQAKRYCFWLPLDPGACAPDLFVVL